MSWRIIVYMYIHIYVYAYIHVPYHIYRFYAFLVCAVSLANVQGTAKGTQSAPTQSWMAPDTLWQRILAIYTKPILVSTLHWRHNERAGVSNHQPHDCLLNRLFRRRSKKSSKFRVTGPLCGEFTGTQWIPRTKASDEENVSIWWRHHE